MLFSLFHSVLGYRYVPHKPQPHKHERISKYCDKWYRKAKTFNIFDKKLSDMWNGGAKRAKEVSVSADGGNSWRAELKGSAPGGFGGSVHQKKLHILPSMPHSSSVPLTATHGRLHWEETFTESQFDEEGEGVAVWKQTWGYTGDRRYVLLNHLTFNKPLGVMVHGNKCTDTSVPHCICDAGVMDSTKGAQSSDLNRISNVTERKGDQRQTHGLVQAIGELEGFSWCFVFKGVFLISGPQRSVSLQTPFAVGVLKNSGPCHRWCWKLKRSLSTV